MMGFISEAKQRGTAREVGDPTGPTGRYAVQRCTNAKILQEAVDLWSSSGWLVHSVTPDVAAGVSATTFVVLFEREASR